MEMSRGAEGGASSPDKAKLAPGWWLRCARASLNQLQAVAQKRVPNLEDDGSNCGSGGGLGDEEALDHPVKPFVQQQKEEAETRRIMEGGSNQQPSQRDALLLQMQAGKPLERAESIGTEYAGRNHLHRNKNSFGRLHAAALSLSRYHHDLHGTSPSSYSDLSIVDALLELASKDHTGSVQYMIESMAAAVQALHRHIDSNKHGNTV